MNIWDKYLSGLGPEQKQAVLNTLKTAEQFIPQAEAAISYGMPTWKTGGKSVISVAAWKNHLGIYPHGDLPAEIVDTRLSEIDSDKGTFRFSYEKLPTKTQLEVIIKSKLELIDSPK